jgi:hypothetical protein
MTLCIKQFKVFCVVKNETSMDEIFLHAVFIENCHRISYNVTNNNISNKNINNNNNNNINNKKNVIVNNNDDDNNNDNNHNINNNNCEVILKIKHTTLPNTEANKNNSFLIQ